MYIAVAVLEQGRLELSPRDQMFGYFKCLKVLSWTLTNPAALPNPDYDINEGGLIGGVICKKS